MATNETIETLRNSTVFGTNESFIPVNQARYAGEEQRLYEYYSLTAGTATTGVANTGRPPHPAPAQLPPSQRANRRGGRPSLCSS